ncbi:unnamed protein product [Oreochromis niloticus]|nr:unnamed protein product [Mustela putorius furo]
MLGLMLLFMLLSDTATLSTANRDLADEDGQVLLPCVYRRGVLTQPVNAFWRDKDDRVVLDIVNGSPDKMDPKVRGRVVSFKDEYKHGNVSILITRLRLQDAGPYECDIPKVEFQTKITLTITRKVSVQPTAAETTNYATDANEAAIYALWNLTLLLCLGLVQVL